MANELSAFSSRAFIIPNYSAPLYAHVLDTDERFAEQPLDAILQDVLLVPQRRVITNEKWHLIADIALDVLRDDEFWQRALQEQQGYRELWHQQIADFLAYYRSEATHQVQRIREDKSYFAHQALSSLVYQASEGNFPDYEYGVATALPLPIFSTMLTDELVERTLKNQDYRLGTDDLRIWRQVNSLVLSSVSQEFKQSFSPLLSYDIPYGLSPQTKSDTLEALIKNARMVAVLPAVSGIQTVSTALASSQWVVAIQGAVTTGATVIILLSSFAMADVIIRWMKNRENQQ